MTQKKNNFFFENEWNASEWKWSKQKHYSNMFVCFDFAKRQKTNHSPQTKENKIIMIWTLACMRTLNTKLCFFGISLHYPREWRMTQSSVYGAYVHVFAIILVVDCVCTRARLLLLFWNQQLNECPHCSDMEKLFASMFFCATSLLIHIVNKRRRLRRRRQRRRKRRRIKKHCHNLYVWCE